MLIRRLLLIGSVAVVGVLAIGCGHNRVKVADTRGPDGSGEWHRISCKRMDKKCFQTARAMCPDGYIFTKQSVSKARYDDEQSSSKEKRSRKSLKDSDSSDEANGGTVAVKGNVKTLPTEEKWGDEMYTKKPGTLMVRCADRATQVASNTEAGY